MQANPLDGLLGLLGGGDEIAARAFVEYEPLLRRAVRRCLPPRYRTRFDSADIVQSVWVSILRRFHEQGCRFADAEHLEAFLLRATRNRLIDRIRQHGKAIDQQEPLPLSDNEGEAPSALTPPGEHLQAEDLWQRMLSLCPPEHHEILRLRRQGYSYAEVAARTGLHGDSVRRILRRLAGRIAFDGPAPEGDL
jgi:RNA polymerase sigma-70 factor (ECF subfamily)